MPPLPTQPSSGVPAPVPAPAPPGFVDSKPSGEIPPSGETAGLDAGRWPEGRSRYADLLSQRADPMPARSDPVMPRSLGEPHTPRPMDSAPGAARPMGSSPPIPRPLDGGNAQRSMGGGPGAPLPRPVGERTPPSQRPPLIQRPGDPGSAPGPGPGPGQRDRPPGPGERTTGVTYPDRLGTPLRRDFDAPTPASAPPYPYEGDLDDTASLPQPVTQRAAVPLVRPAAPGARQAGWSGGSPDDPRAARQTADDPRAARQAYDPASFPRRIPEPSRTGGDSYVPPPAYAATGNRSSLADAASRVLPQRVPAQPDVPKVPDPPLVETTAETPALARIATHLRRGDVLQPREREEGFDVQAILAAVRGVDGVRDASLRSAPSGAHSLRLDLAEGADPAEVSRRVARLLQDRMGLDAAMKGDAAAAPPPAPVSPSALVPSAGNRPVSAPAVAAVSPPPVLPTRPVERRDPIRPVERREPTRAAERRESVRAAAERDEKPGTMVPVDAEPFAARPLYPGEQPGPRVVIENVFVNTYGTDASVEVRLGVGDQTAAGQASGPAVDGYLLRLCALAAAGAVDKILATSQHPDGPARCFVEHAVAVPFGGTQVAVVVLLLSCNGWVEQLSGSAVVTGDDRHAMVRATLAAVNRRLEALLSR